MRVDVRALVRSCVHACVHMRADTRVHACVTFSAFNSLLLSPSILSRLLFTCIFYIYMILRIGTVLLIAVTLERRVLLSSIVVYNRVYLGCVYLKKTRRKYATKNASSFYFSRTLLIFLILIFFIVRYMHSKYIRLQQLYM